MSTNRECTRTNQSLKHITFGNGQFVAVGVQGTIITSSDAIAWTVRSSGITAPLNAIAFGGNQFVAVGSGATIISSPDGVDWTKRSSPVDGGLNSLYSVAFGNGVFVTVGDNSYVSPDGATWTHPDLFAGTLFKVAYTGNAFVALGVQGGIFVSPDGIEWKKKNVMISDEGITYDAAFGNNRFVVGGSRGLITGAPEDSLWTLRYPGVSAAMQSIAYGKGRFVAVGWNGAILSCDENNLGARMQAPSKTAPGRLRITVNRNTLIMHLPESAENRKLSLQIMTLSGKSIHTAALKSTNRSLALSINAFAKGTYLLNVSSRGVRVACSKFNVF